MKQLSDTHPCWLFTTWACNAKVYDGIFVLYLFGAEPNFYPQQ